MNEPSYKRLHETGELKTRIAESLSLLKECRICPRRCGADRMMGTAGFCRTGRYAKVASFCPHFGEELPLVGTGGSGTIFFSSCNILCSFCQNYDISHFNEGSVTRPEALAAMMLELAREGCHNINFVTPSHVVPQILEALPYAIEGGLDLPLVYNSGGYDTPETLGLLKDIFDIYMPDFKFWDPEYAQVYCTAPDYPQTARAAVLEMHSQVGDLTTDRDGIAGRGLLVRHLVMPGGVAGTAEVMSFIAREISVNTYVNIMDQYRPCHRALADESISRRITLEEYRNALRSAESAGLVRLDAKGGMFFFDSEYHALNHWSGTTDVQRIRVPYPARLTTS